MEFRLEYGREDKREAIGEGPLVNGDYLVGRGDHGWVYIDGPGFILDKEPIGPVVEPSVTRLIYNKAHLEIVVSEDCLTLTDTSKFGTFVKNKRIQTHDIKEQGTYDVRLGDVFTFDIIASE